MKLIDKAAVVAEIEKLKGQLLHGSCSSQISMQTYCKEEAYDEVLSYLDTLEVKEVVLEREVADYIEQHKRELSSGYFDIRRIARHFFVLGLNKAKGE